MPTSGGTSGSSWPRWDGWTWPWSRTRLISPPVPSAVRSERRPGMPDSRVSVLILAKNEAQNLPDCLASVRWADEVVVVVDRESRDDTETVARRAATVVVVRDFADFASQRNAALALASGE